MDYDPGGARCPHLAEGDFSAGVSWLGFANNHSQPE